MKNVLNLFVILLLVITVGSLGTLGWYYFETSSELSSLTKNNEDQEKKISKFEMEVDKKDNQIEVLEEEVETQKTRLVFMSERVEEYEAALTKLSVSFQSVNNELNYERLKKVPENYYSETLYQYTDSVQGLSDFLTYGFELPASYEIGVFDCSESSAYLEWALEKQGFDAKICVGWAPFEPTVKHAWVIVSTDDGYSVAIEATALTGGSEKWLNMLSSIFDNKGRGVIYYNQNDPVSVKYYENYDGIFESIYEVVDSTNLEEWNWWEGAWGLN